MIKFLVIVQDLRVSGTSEGIVSRSFLGKLRLVYPKAFIEVLYLPHFDTDDALDLLPVNTLTRHVISTKIPFYVKWINRITTRVFDVLYADNYRHKQYAKCLKNIDAEAYDHIFVRSSGLGHETLLATHNLPLLKKAILNFHDPYPSAWYGKEGKKIHKNEFLRLKKMIEVVAQAKACCSPAFYLSSDLQYLYATDTPFYTLPHQFDPTVFNLDKKEQVRPKQATFQIAYHGALMFGRNVFNVLQAYEELVKEETFVKQETEFVLRIKGEGVTEIKTKYKDFKNVVVLDCLDFSNSYNEQLYESDLNLILENGPDICNILVGKAAFLAAYQKPVLCVSPPKSELRSIIKEDAYIADMNSVADIKTKLKRLIENRLVSQEPVFPFGDYFSVDSFEKYLNRILS